MMMKRQCSLVCRFFLGVVVLSLLACGDSARLSPLPEDATVLAFGDSLTVGVGAASEHSYPAVLSRNLDLTIINAGVSGEVTADGKNRLTDVLTKLKPDLVIICHGGNDFLHRFALDETEKNLRAMVSQVQSSGAEAVLIGVPKPGIWGRAPDLYRRIAREFKVPLDDVILGELETDAKMKSDPVHLNQQGYKKLADAVVALLIEAGAVSPREL